MATLLKLTSGDENIGVFVCVREGGECDGYGLATFVSQEVINYTTC